MKILLAGAVAAGALLAVAQAEETAKFDLWLATEAGQSLIAVSGVAEGAPFVVASGADAAALDILADDAASLVIAELQSKTEKTAIEAVVADAGDAAAAGEAIIEKQIETTDSGEAKPAIHKIVLVKKTEETGEAKETKQIIKLNTDKDMDAEEIKAVIAEAKADIAAGDKDANVDVQEETIVAEGDDAAILALADDSDAKVMILETANAGAETRLVKIGAADADAARQFIDDAKGLDDAEKTAMKAKLAL
jgi:hypothetical protein